MIKYVESNYEGHFMNVVLKIIWLALRVANDGSRACVQFEKGVRRSFEVRRGLNDVIV